MNELFLMIEIHDMALSFLRGARRVFHDEESLLHEEDKRGKSRVQRGLNKINLSYDRVDSRISVLVELQRRMNSRKG